MENQSPYKVIDLRNECVLKIRHITNKKDKVLGDFRVLDDQGFEGLLADMYSKGWKFHSMIEFDRRWVYDSFISLKVYTTGVPIKALFERIEHFPHPPYRG